MVCKFKCFAITLLMLLMLTSESFAAMPDISAGETEFNLFKGCYIFKDNVRVSDSGMTLTAQRAVAQMTSQKVWATGGVSFEQSGLKFKCDKIFVKAADSKVEVIGKLDFVQDGTIKISGDVGTFSWDSKCADFYGKVKLTINKNSKINIASNIKSKKLTGTYAHIRYNLAEKKIIALDKEYSPIPKQDFSEPDPTA